MLWIWKRGWLLNSLKYRVEKDIQETLYKNQYFLNNRWSRVERLIIWGSKHLFWANVCLVSIAILISIVISTKYTFLKKYLPMPLDSLAPILEFRSTIFTAQITILGLIFPLVIALVSILLKGQSSNKSMWMVYRQTSGFMLVASSALSLIGLFIISNSFEPWLTHQRIVASSISITSWFIINLLLTGNFLWKTVQFLDLNERMSTIVKYAINEVVAFDIKKRLLFHHCANASENGLLLKPVVGEYEITTFPREEFKHEVNLIFSKPKSIVNIWYRLLNIGIWIWAFRIQPPASGEDKLTLSIPLSMDGYKQKNIVLAGNSIKTFNCLAAFFIKTAVKTTSKSEPEQLYVRQVISALFGQVEDALKDNNSGLFKLETDRLIDIYSEIESTAAFINDDGDPDNWLLLSDAKWFGISFLDEFIKESTEISKRNHSAIFLKKVDKFF